MLNPFYLENKAAVKEHFANNELPHVVLHEFLEKQAYQELVKQVGKISLEHKKNPLLYSYKEAELESNVFLTAQIKAFIEEIFDQEIVTKSVLRAFTHKDYQLRTHNNKEEYLVIFDMTQDFPINGGGNIVCIDPNGETHQFTPAANCLILIKKPADIDWFVQYVNHYGDKRLFFLTTF